MTIIKGGKTSSQGLVTLTVIVKQYLLNRYSNHLQVGKFIIIVFNV